MAEGQTAWLLALQQCWHIVGQPGTGTDIKGGCGQPLWLSVTWEERVAVWHRLEGFYFRVKKNFGTIESWIIWTK